MNDQNDPVSRAFQQLRARMDALEARMSQAEHQLASGATPGAAPAPPAIPLVFDAPTPRPPPAAYEENWRQEPVEPPPVAPEARPQNPYSSGYGRAPSRIAPGGLGGTPGPREVIVGVPRTGKENP